MFLLCRWFNCGYLELVGTPTTTKKYSDLTWNVWEVFRRFTEKVSREKKGHIRLEMFSVAKLIFSFHFFNINFEKPLYISTGRVVVPRVSSEIKKTKEAV